MTFGETLKSLRESKNLTQKQLGEQIGISRPTINLWERGKVKPTKPETVEKLANALGVTVKDLIGDEVVSVKEKKAAPNKEKAAADAEEKPLAVVGPLEEAIADTEIPSEEKTVSVSEVPSEEVISATETPTEEKAITPTSGASSKAISLGTRLATLLAEADEAVSLTEEEAVALKEVSAVSEEEISSAPKREEKASAEAISLATRLAILLPELSASEKDAVMVSLNAAYWRSR